MEIKRIKITNSDGMNIAAAVHYPEVDKNYLAILCPGNLDSKDYNHLIKLAEALAIEGYTAVRFDPLGTWESEGSDSDYSVTQYLKDIKTVLDFMLKQKAFDKILLGGHSRGGEVSILYAAQDPRISMVLPIMPPTPISDEELQEDKFMNWKKNGFNISVRDVPASDTTKSYKLPYGHVMDRLKYNVIDAVKNIHVLIIFVAGELDVICTPEEIKIIFDNANEPKKYIFIKGIGHDYRHNLSEIDQVNEEIVDALSQ